MKIKPGLLFGALALLLGALSDYFNGKQMEIEVKETVDEELARYGLQRANTDE